MSERGVTLITCTGNRPAALDLCEQFVARQTWRGPMQWIVVDDGQVATPQNCCRPEMLRTDVYPEPRWQPGQNTLARNLLAAIPEVLNGYVLFLEDDDWYSPDYVEAMAAELDSCEIAGEAHARYYHVRQRLHLTCPNTHHASMCATGIRAELLPLLRQICLQAAGLSPYLDIHLWERTTRCRHRLTETARCIGIKGLPGRDGIGMGHRPETHLHQWTADPDMGTLRSWIGDDVEMYREYGIRH